MVNQQLLEYIKSEQAKGISKEQIRQMLTSGGGWHPEDVEEAFSQLNIGTMDNAALNSIPQKYAGFWIRFVANVIDGWVVSLGVGIIGIIVGILLASVSMPSNVTSFIFTIVNSLLVWMYFILMTHFKGATLGKMAVGIRVKADNNERLPLGRIVLRETVGKIISTVILFVGYMMAGWTKKKQALHDKIAKSVVVYKNSNPKTNIAVIIVVVVFGFLGALAVIGILSSIFLVSLDVARSKGADAAIEANLEDAGAQAANYYDSNSNSYAGICTTPVGSGGVLE